MESTELQEWELLLHPNSPSDSELDHKNKDHTFLETEALIQTNYFSIHNTPFAAYTSEKGSDESGNPTCLEATKLPTNNSGSEKSDDSQFEGGNDEMAFGGIDETEVKLGQLDEVGVVENSNLQMGFHGIEEMGVLQNSKIEEVDFEGIEDIVCENGKNHEESWSDNGGVGVADVEERSKDERVEVSKEGGEDKRSLVWWKVPLELIKYCVFRVKPMWAFSVAAAVMGFLILGRRLHKMKKKTKGLELKVTVDDKKVSQFMSRAARLNEAFSVVKRVPVIRPQLPAPGVSAWPLVSLR